MEEIVSLKPLITNDAVVFGILMALLMAIFYTAEQARFKKFYSVVPALLLCYFLPSLFNTLGIISPAWLDLEAALSALAQEGYVPAAPMSSCMTSSTGWRRSTYRSTSLRPLPAVRGSISWLPAFCFPPV